MTPASAPVRARRPRRSPGHRTVLAALALSLAPILLAGCDSSPGQATSAVPEASSAASGGPASGPTSPSRASDGPGTTAATGNPDCPDAAALFALGPNRPTDLRPTGTTCSGTWALLGVSGPARAQDVLLFEYVDGTWRLRDEAEACVAGDSLPAAVARSVCDAG